MGSLDPDKPNKQDLDDSGCVEDTPMDSYKGQVRLLDLSDDVLLCILRFCTPRDLKALGHTCRRLGILICDRTLWLRVDARSSQTGSERMRWFLDYVLTPATQELQLTGYVDRYVRCLGIQDLAWPPVNEDIAGQAGVRAAVDVEHFLLRMWYPHLPRYAMSPRWPDRREIYNRQRERERALSPLSQLESKIDENSPSTSKASTSGHSSPNSGKNPGDPGDNPDNGDGDDDIDRGCTNGCQGPQFTMDLDLLRALRNKCHNLTSLSLEYCNLNYKSTNLRHFPPKLKKLSLKGTRCYNLPLNTSFLGKIQDRLPELEYLDLSECDWFEPASLMPLSKMPKLAQLYIKDCARMTECVAYASLATRYGFQKLKILDVRGSPVADSEVSAFGWLPLLEELYVSAAVTDTTMTEHAHKWHDVFFTPIELEPWEQDEPDYFKCNSRIEYMDDDDDSRDDGDGVGQERLGDVMLGNYLNCASLERRIIVIHPNRPNHYNRHEQAHNQQENLPENQPGNQPGNQAENQPDNQPEEQPEGQPKVQHENRPEDQPENLPENQPQNEPEDQAKDDQEDNEMPYANNDNYYQAPPRPRQSPPRPPPYPPPHISHHMDIRHLQRHLEYLHANGKLNRQCQPGPSKRPNTDNGVDLIKRPRLEASKQNQNQNNRGSVKAEVHFSVEDGQASGSQGQGSQGQGSQSQSSGLVKVKSVHCPVGHHYYETVKHKEDEAHQGNEGENQDKPGEENNQNKPEAVERSKDQPMKDDQQPSGSKEPQDKPDNAAGEGPSNQPGGRVRPRGHYTLEIANLDPGRPLSSVSVNIRPIPDPQNPNEELQRPSIVHQIIRDGQAVPFQGRQPIVVHARPNDRLPADRGNGQAAEGQERVHRRRFVQRGEDGQPVMQIDVDIQRQNLQNLNLPPTINTGFHLVTDSAVLRFGRADNDNVNYVHIGGNNNRGNEQQGVRPDRSNLRVLSITGYRNITDRSLEHLATAAPYIRRIDFSRTSVTDRGVEVFKAIRPNCEVIYSEYKDDQPS